MEIIHLHTGRSIQLLKKQQWPTGLFNSNGHANIRDTIYQAIGLEDVAPLDATRAYHGIFNILLRYEYKLDWAIKKRPTHGYQYISPYYTPQLIELEAYRNTKQNDIIGLFLFKVGELQDRGFNIIRTDNDLCIIKKLVGYLASIRYWKDKDNGMWNQKEEVHASSVGACVAGLSEIRSVVHVPKRLIMEGFRALNNLLPKEYTSRSIDVSLLSLIYPFDIIYSDQRELILAAVEDTLLREHGAIRYVGDRKYNLKGVEAEFTMALPWLALIYKQLNQPHKYRYYREKTLNALAGGQFPEAYYGNTKLHTQPSPCNTTHALFAKLATNES